MKLTIYTGKEKPFVAVGKHQCRLLEFAYNYPTWHYYNNKCLSTKKALTALVNRGVIKLNNFDQFIINY